MKVYVVNVNNCRAYSDYHEGNVGVYASRAAAVDDMTRQGFNPATRRRIVPWPGMGPDWYDFGFYDTEQYRVEEWTLQGVAGRE